MNPLNSIIPGDCCESPKPQIESPNLLETFKRKKLRLTQQLADVDAVIKALEDNPSINQLFELIAKAR